MLKPSTCPRNRNRYRSRDARCNAVGREQGGLKSTDSVGDAPGVAFPKSAVVGQP